MECHNLHTLFRSRSDFCMLLPRHSVFSLVHVSAVIKHVTSLLKRCARRLPITLSNHLLNKAGTLRWFPSKRTHHRIGESKKIESFECAWKEIGCLVELWERMHALIKARVIDVKITWVSNCRYPITKSFLNTCNWTPTWSCANYVTNRRTANQSRLRILL